MLGSSETPLSSAYDVAVLDLDGVVYVGPHAVAGAPEALNQAQAGGMHLAFVTNNAARPPATVGEHLRELGVDAHDEDVVTSAQAAARLLAGQLPEGSKVFLIGGQGLDEALRERGLEPVTEPSDEVAAVVQGYGPDMPWKRVVQGAILVRVGTALGGQQHRHDHPDRDRRRSRQRHAGAPGRGVRRARAPGRRQADVAAVRGDDHPGRRGPTRWWSATGWTPTSRARSPWAGTACWCSPA